jgi:hypothetical protein
MPDSAYTPDSATVEAFQRGTGLRYRDAREALWTTRGNVEEALLFVDLENRRLLPREEWYLWRCPECAAGSHHKNEIECKACGWLKYPARNRDNWGDFGPCPGCGWEHRWDGTNCSHCGHVSSGA